MSKFTDRLKQVSEGIPQPIGFRKAGADIKRPRIQLVVAVTGKATAGLTASLSAADAGIFHPKEGAELPETAKKLVEAVDIPWGVNIGDGQAGEVETLTGAGIDFVVFPASTPIQGLLAPKMGRIIEIDISISDALLRSFSGVPVDAVLVGRGRPAEVPVNWEELAGFRRIAVATSKPVIATVPPAISRAELQALWDAGLDGVAVEASGSGGGENVRRLREEIDNLEYPRVKQNQKDIALAPRLSPTQRRELEEEEEEE